MDIECGQLQGNVDAAPAGGTPISVFFVNVKRRGCHLVFINIWNSLPVHVVNSCSVNSFKNNLDRFWSNEESTISF